jgi:hypothetical protein
MGLFRRHTKAVTAGESLVDAARGMTADAAGSDIDLGYITDRYLAQLRDEGGEYASDLGFRLEGEAAEMALATLGRNPLGPRHLAVSFGHQAVYLPAGWRAKVVRFADGTFTPLPTPARFPADVASVVGRCPDGSPLWEFRL